MKFLFSLQTVLDVKHLMVEGLEIQLAQLRNICMQLLALLETLGRVLDDLFESLKEQKEQEEFDIFLILRHHENINYIEGQIAQAEEELKILEEKIEEKRKELVAARQEEEVLEILKEKEYQLLLDAIEAAERKEVDDIYIARAHRMRRENFT